MKLYKNFRILEPFPDNRTQLILQTRGIFQRTRYVLTDEEDLARNPVPSAVDTASRCSYSSAIPTEAREDTGAYMSRMEDSTLRIVKQTFGHHILNPPELRAFNGPKGRKRAQLAWERLFEDDRSANRSTRAPSWGPKVQRKIESDRT